MATIIRPLQDADLPAVAALTRDHLADWVGHESFLRATLLDHPWIDEELPSLVAVDDEGEVIGFIGVQVRRLRLEGGPLRGVCCSHLVVAPRGRPGATGLLLLRQMLSGPQDLSWSDSATEPVLRMWRTLGGNLNHVRAHDWMLVLRPVSWLRGVMGSMVRREITGREIVPVGALPFQAAGRRMVGRAFPELDPKVSSEEASVAAIVEHLSVLTRRTRLYADYDEAHLASLFTQIAKLRAPVVCRLVRRAGQPIGWYVYLRWPRAAIRLLHLAGMPRETEAIFGEFVEQARAAGSSVLTGRADPHLESPLRRHFAVLGFARRPVVHTRNPEVQAALGSSSSLLTQLDGEWFMT